MNFDKLYESVAEFESGVAILQKNLKDRTMYRHVFFMNCLSGYLRQLSFEMKIFDHNRRIKSEDFKSTFDKVSSEYLSAQSINKDILNKYSITIYYDNLCRYWDLTKKDLHQMFEDFNDSD